MYNTNTTAGEKFASLLHKALVRNIKFQAKNAMKGYTPKNGYVTR